MHISNFSHRKTLTTDSIASKNLKWKWEMVMGVGMRSSGTRKSVLPSALRQKGAQLAVTCAAKVKFV